MHFLTLKIFSAPKERAAARAAGARARLGIGLGASLWLGALLAPAARAQPARPGVGTPGLAVDYYRGYYYGDPGFFAAHAPAISNRPIEQLNFAEAENDNFAVGSVATYYTAGQPDEFSGRFQGQLYITAAGQYTFYLGSDDAAYFWLDNDPQPVAANRGDTFPYRETAGTVGLAAGLHTLRVDYGEHGGSQGLVLQYAGPGLPKQVVPNGVFYRPAAAAIQPVLTAFDAVANDQRVNLSWATGAEESSVAFVVQKSVDGVTFTELLRQSGAGTAAGAHRYAAVDPQPASGQNFYRIQQLRGDRGPVYSPIEAVAVGPVPFAVSAYPVPNDGVFYLRVQPGTVDAALLELVDMSGRRVYRQQLQLPGAAVQRVNPGLAIGLYLLRVTTSAGVLVQKLPLGG